MNAVSDSDYPLEVQIFVFGTIHMIGRDTFNGVEHNTSVRRVGFHHVLHLEIQMNICTCKIFLAVPTFHCLDGQ